MLNNIFKTLTSTQIKEAHFQLQAVWWQQQPIRSELSSDTSPASPISEYNPPKQYWQASPIILYEWCYDAKLGRQRKSHKGRVAIKRSFGIPSSGLMPV